MLQHLRFLVVGCVFVTMSCVADSASGWNHEAHFNPANPRPDFLPHTIYNAWCPYRKEYNRPRFVGGAIAAHIEPTSQEAMSWCIHQANGDYRNHRPGYIPLYMYPKPWEVLSVEPRPNAALSSTTGIGQPTVE
jgi:hypothetical protein